VIYFCADDYGLNDISSKRILDCLKNGSLNKVSVFPNLESFDVKELLEHKDVRLSLHLNLVEGKCMAEQNNVPLFTDSDGNFKYSFGGLLKLDIFNRKEFIKQLYEEIRAQVLYYKSIMPSDVPFCIDSHQHTHMIPSVFKTLIRVLEDENISVEYIRIPAEPILPYLKTPSLYFTYDLVNVIKQWLLNFLWLFNKRLVKNKKLPSAYFFGILFSGKMDKRRVEKILTKYKKIADKHGKDIEVLFHPGFLDEDEVDFADKNIKFKKFYFSENRKTEFDSAMNISERSV
jgi:predicted glycoside hydrolase/deacetylase ChbG (UPF0249 family)